jgi:uncharacterized damage-inducible protein DinB
MSAIFSKFTDIKNSHLNYLTLILFFLFGLNLPLVAQQKDSTNQFKIDFFKVFDSSSKKIMELSEAIPFEDYKWRPAEKIRSINESLMHVVNTNYYLASKLNSPLPEDVMRDDSKSFKTKKAAREILVKSIDHVREAIQNISNEQLYSTVDFWGRKETMQRVILQVSEHMAEHLGQLIAYARMRGVAPPWSK